MSCIWETLANVSNADDTKHFREAVTVGSVFCLLLPFSCLLFLSPVYFSQPDFSQSSLKICTHSLWSLNELLLKVQSNFMGYEVASRLLVLITRIPLNLCHVLQLYKVWHFALVLMHIQQHEKPQTWWKSTHLQCHKASLQSMRILKHHWPISQKGIKPTSWLE